MRITTGKNKWVLLIYILCGLVVGGFLGYYLGEFKYFDWLAYGKNFGFDNPIILELGIIKLQFGIFVRINMASVIGILIAILLYKRT